MEESLLKGLVFQVGPHRRWTYISKLFMKNMAHTRLLGIILPLIVILSLSISNGQDKVVTNKLVGIIIPPLKIKKIADKKAEFVAKNGSSFETMLNKAEANNPKFCLLKDNDPYRAYYEQKMTEFAIGIASEVVHQFVKPRFDEPKKVEVPPPPDQYSVEHPSIPLIDMH